MDRKTSREILTIHRERFLACKSFEEYRDAHAAYITMLIERYQAEEKAEEAMECATKIEMKWMQATPDGSQP